MELKNKYPKTWTDFVNWLIDPNNKSWFDSVDMFRIYPFEMQLGVYLKYMEEKELNQVMFEMLYDVHTFGRIFLEDLKEVIEQAFKIREKQLND